VRGRRRCRKRTGGNARHTTGDDASDGETSPPVVSSSLDASVLRHVPAYRTFARVSRKPNRASSVFCSHVEG